MPAGGLTFNKEFPTLVPKAKVKGSQRTARRGKIKANEIACVAGPQFYGGPDLQRAGFWRARILPRARQNPARCKSGPP